MMRIYFDESGDLGWIFDQPYGKGGSSRYLTMAFLFLPEIRRNVPKNLIKGLYKKYNWKNEKKANSATLNQKILFSQKCVDRLRNYPDIKIDVITVKKQNVSRHIQADPNTLYNYMAGLVIPDYVGSESTIDLIPDERTIKVESTNSFAEYLKVKLWCEHGYSIGINYSPTLSHHSYHIQFADWLCHCIWIKFEKDTSAPYKILRSHINVRHLFFSNG
jgi:hypothetical protein